MIILCKASKGYHQVKCKGEHGIVSRLFFSVSFEIYLVHKFSYQWRINYIWYQLVWLLFNGNCIHIQRSLKTKYKTLPIMTILLNDSKLPQYLINLDFKKVATLFKIRSSISIMCMCIKNKLVGMKWSRTQNYVVHYLSQTDRKPYELQKSRFLYIIFCQKH